MKRLLGQVGAAERPGLEAGRETRELGRQTFGERRIERSELPRRVGRRLTRERRAQLRDGGVQRSRCGAVGRCLLERRERGRETLGVGGRAIELREGRSHHELEVVEHGDLLVLVLRHERVDRDHVANGR